MTEDDLKELEEWAATTGDNVLFDTSVARALVAEVRHCRDLLRRADALIEHLEAELARCREEGAPYGHP